MQQTITRFRGSAGEVTRGAMSLATVFTAMELGVIIFVLMFLLHKSGIAMPDAIAPYLTLVFSSLIVGRFALASRLGNYHAGLFNKQIEYGDAFHFAIRYALLTLIWMIPLSVIYWLSFGDMPSNPARGLNPPMRGFLSFELWLRASYLFLLNIVYMVLIHAGLLMATYTEDLTEVFSPAPWTWLFLDRAKDLKAYFSTLIGTGITFLFWFYIPGSLLLFCVIKVISDITRYPFYAMAYTTLVVMCFGYAYLLIITGRLVGAFVEGDDEIDGIIEQDIVAKATTKAGVIKHDGLGDTVRVKPVAFNLKSIASDVKALSPEECQQQLAALGQNNDLAAVVTRTLLYQQLEDNSQSLAAAATAIPLCIVHGKNQAAIDLFRLFSTQRAELPMPPGDWQRLAKLFAHQQSYADAAWCQYQSTQGEKGLAPIVIQKVILSLADSAAQHGKTDQAVTIYRFFLKKFPDAELKGFVEERLSHLT